jgi:predicted nucleic acid-binding protein
VLLADTSVWIDHFRRGNATLVTSLNDGQVATHPFVIGELACGQLHARRKILSLLAGLPASSEVTHEEAMLFADTHHLYGRGLGWIDIHLLASVAISNIALWTLDRRLAAAHANIARR